MQQWSEESVQLRRGRGNKGYDARHSLNIERVTRWKLSVPRVGPIAGPLTMSGCPSWKFELEVHTSTSKNSVTINNKLQFEYLMKTNAILNTRHLLPTSCLCLTDPLVQSCWRLLSFLLLILVLHDISSHTAQCWVRFAVGCLCSS